MSRKDIYVEMAHHPQVILDAMEQVELAVDRAAFRQQLLRFASIALMVIGLLSFGLAFLLAERNDSAVCFFAGFPLFFIGFILYAVFKGRGNPMLREHFGAARQLLHTLRDDTGRKGRVVGRLDLSGPQQDQKTTRTARSGGGKKKVYYRDPWLRVKFKLVDGNVLRLTLEDKVKTKANSIVRHQTQYSAKLVVNPDLYRLGEIPPHTVRVPFATFTHEGGVFVVKAARSAKDLSAQQVLEMLKAMYSYLEPIEPESAISP